MKNILLIITSIFILSCTTPIETGVSHELAKKRKATIKQLEYILDFNIPNSLDQKCSGSVEVRFQLAERGRITLDFKAPKEYIHNVNCDYKFINEHIIVDGKEGQNSIKIEFTLPDQSLNRRQEFLYTLLVPDRARTLFPCFDQPNLKAKFTLGLTIPDNWVAISNGKMVSREGNHIRFSQTEPLSTYLFSIVAGELECVTDSQNGHTVSLYHRETDSLKLAQIGDIFGQVYASLNWLEEYTAIDYPFAKYDLIILPGFQYGGMEHTGATIYNDRLMFLNPNPTINEQLNRSNLIAHETAHMWFGDFVTMDWFSDVWTKEVFANYFASQITAPQFPEVNHDLIFMLLYAPSAYSEDRTKGANPIQQELDNLQDAGLVYGSIIYKKSPMVMNMLVEILGEETFRKGVQTYLQRFAYSNATWDDLISILDDLSQRDLQSWSDAWIKEAGMPEITVSKDLITQRDPLGRGVVWGQPLALYGDTIVRVMLERDSIINPIQSPYIIPNADGRSYGFFRLDTATANYCMKNITTFSDVVMRGSVLASLYENFLNRVIPATDYMDFLISYLPTEQNQLLFGQAVGHCRSCFSLSFSEHVGLENVLGELSLKSITALRAYSHIVRTDKEVAKLFQLWDSGTLSERDAIDISYQLAVLIPDKCNEIIQKQMSRITNNDRLKEYKFIAPSVSNSPAVRDSVFNSLLLAENRGIEPWAESALSMLNHPLRQSESIKYIRAALEAMKDIQKTGDIFFPTAWCNALLAGHSSKAARMEVDRFFEANADYPTKLAGKIKQRSYHLYFKQ